MLNDLTELKRKCHDEAPDPEREKSDGAVACCSAGSIGCLLHQAQHSLRTLGDDLTDRCVP